MSVGARRTAQWHSLGESKLPSRTAPSRSGTRPQGTTSGEGLASRTTTTSYRQRTRPVAPKLARASSRRLWYRAARSSRPQGSTTAKAKPAKATRTHVLEHGTRPVAPLRAEASFHLRDAWPLIAAGPKPSGHEDRSRATFRPVAPGDGSKLPPAWHRAAHDLRTKALEP